MADLMTRSGIMEPDDVASLDTLISAAEKITEASRVSSTLADSGTGVVDPLTDFLLRIQGAKLGSFASAAGPAEGHGLVAAQAGSSYVRKLFNRLGVESTQKVLIDAAMDNDFMAMLLTKPATQQEGFQLGRQIHAYLLNAGYRFADEQLSEDQEADRRFQAVQPVGVAQ